MSVDRLQEKIRKLKNPTVVEFDFTKEHIPPAFLEADSFFPSVFEIYSKALLDGLKDLVPAVRFSLNRAAVYGAEGIISLKELLRYASKLGYYVLLDAPASMSLADAQLAADNLFTDEWKFDGLVVTAYIGSDAIRPYVQKLEDTKRSVFVVTRSSNKSCQELQDLLTGSRLVYQAMADVVNRFAQGSTGRSGYGPVASVAAANAPEALRILREKYKYQFLLVEGYDAPNANAKNCANSFDKLGHGAAVCAGTSVTGAWLEDPWVAQEYMQAAQEAVQRMKKNLTRYVTIL
jgi:orotidine-5'-phosphate decarboxylase